MNAKVSISNATLVDRRTGINRRNPVQPVDLVPALRRSLAYASAGNTRNNDRRYLS